MLVSVPITSIGGGAADREAEPPAAHAERLAEGVGGDALVEHVWLAQQRVVPARARPSRRRARR